MILLSALVATLPVQMSNNPISQALTQMGGRQKLAAVTSIKARGLRTQNLLEQSVRFEGPWLRNLFEFEEEVDFHKLEHRVQETNLGDQFADPVKIKFSYGFLEGIRRSGTTFLNSAEESADRLREDPIRMLLAAENAADLREGKPTNLYGVPCHRMQFSVGTGRYDLLISKYSHLPMALESTARRTDFWSIWGDVQSHTEYGNWLSLPGGLRYPATWHTRRNGLPHVQTTLTSVKLETSLERAPVPLESATVSLNPETLNRMPTATIPRATLVAEGVLKFRGGFDTHLIEVGQGLVVVDPIVGSEYQEAFLATIAKSYPNRPILGVVATDDSWPHAGGLRAYVARNIPVYALAENRPFVERLASTRFTLQPDELERRKARLRFKAVSGPTTIGDGPNRMVLLPLRGAESERMLAVYFPDRKLLYGSDLIQTYPGGKLYSVELARELAELVTRERLEVETVFAMHSVPMPWSRFLKLIDDAYQPVNSSPNSAIKDKP